MAKGSLAFRPNGSLSYQATRHTRVQLPRSVREVLSSVTKTLARKLAYKERFIIIPATFLVMHKHQGSRGIGFSASGRSFKEVICIQAVGPRRQGVIVHEWHTREGDRPIGRLVAGHARDGGRQRQRHAYRASQTPTRTTSRSICRPIVRLQDFLKTFHHPKATVATEIFGLLTLSKQHSYNLPMSFIKFSQSIIKSHNLSIN